MTVWNLTEFSEMENCVLTPYERVPAKVQSRGKMTLRVKGIIVMAAAATAFTISDVQASSGTFCSPASAAGYAQSGTEQKPPLEHLFVDRFNSNWSETLEDALLTKVEEQRKALNKEDLVTQAIESIFFNQQEDVTENADRLSKKEIEKIVRQRKLV